MIVKLVACSEEFYVFARDLPQCIANAMNGFHVMGVSNICPIVHRILSYEIRDELRRIDLRAIVNDEKLEAAILLLAD